MLRRAIIAVVAALTLSHAPPGLAATSGDVADTYSSLWVFGDSLSDPGNLNALTGGLAAAPPYYQGRFSNGPVWADYIAAEFEDQGKPWGNTAYGGARAIENGDFIPDFDAQLGVFRDNFTPFLGDRPLASVLFGANDLFTAVVAGTGTSTAMAAAEKIGANVRRLAALGIHDFAIWNLPDLGATPRVSLYRPDLSAAGTEATQIFNAVLDGIIDGLRRDGLRVAEIDLYALFEDVRADPESYDLVETGLPCLFADADVAAGLGQALRCSPGEAAERLFYDDFHPNGVAHQALAGILADAVVAAPVPLPASGLLLIAGFGALVLRRRAGRAQVSLEISSQA